MRGHRHISQRELHLPDAVIGKLLGIAAENKSIISLGPGEPDFPLPKPIISFIRKKGLADCNHYSPTPGRTDLRKAIARKLRKDNKVDVDWERIIVGCGAQEILFSALLSAIDPKERVIIQNPGYLAYLPAVELVNGKPVFLQLKEDENWEINPDRLKKVINKKTKVLILNTPANPTGNVLSKKVLEEIADIAIDNDLYIFSDETYEKIIYGGKKHVSIGSLNGVENHVLTIGSFSKTYSMTGFRVGYAAVPNKLIDAISKVSHYTVICAPNPSQVIAKYALSINKKYIDKMVKEYDRRRKFMVKRLNEIGLSTVEPFGAFYSFSNIKGITKLNSFKFANKLLKNAKVAVVPGTEFGKYGEGYIRCSYATDYNLIDKAMTKLEKFVK